MTRNAMAMSTQRYLVTSAVSAPPFGTHRQRVGDAASIKHESLTTMSDAFHCQP